LRADTLDEQPQRECHFEYSHKYPHEVGDRSAEETGQLQGKTCHEQHRGEHAQPGQRDGDAPGTQKEVREERVLPTAKQVTLMRVPLPCSNMARSAVAAAWSGGAATVFAVATDNSCSVGMVEMALITLRSTTAQGQQREVAILVTRKGMQSHGQHHGISVLILLRKRVGIPDGG
jgi:hypothetical protein